MKALNLQALRDSGAFVDPAPVRKEVEWTHKGADGKPFTDQFVVHIRRHAFGLMDRLRAEKGRSTSAAIVSECVLLGEAADETMSYDEAFNLDPSLALALVTAVNEVNSAKN